MVCVLSRLCLEPTGARIWGIKSVAEDFHLVLRWSKQITVLYFGNLRKAGNSWALLACVTAVSFSLPSRARVCLHGSFWSVPWQSWPGDAVPGWPAERQVQASLQCRQLVEVPRQSWLNPGRTAGVSGRTKASPERESLGEAGLLFLSVKRRWDLHSDWDVAFLPKWPADVPFTSPSVAAPARPACCGSGLGTTQSNGQTPYLWGCEYC